MWVLDCRVDWLVGWSDQGSLVGFGFWCGFQIVGFSLRFNVLVCWVQLA